MKINFRSVVEVLAWVSLPVIVFAEAYTSTMCWEATCINLFVYSLIPVSFIILAVNSCMKKNYQAVIVFLVLIYISCMSLYQHWQYGQTSHGPQHPDYSWR